MIFWLIFCDYNLCICIECKWEMIDATQWSWFGAISWHFRVHSSSLIPLLVMSRFHSIFVQIPLPPPIDFAYYFIMAIVFLFFHSWFEDFRWMLLASNTEAVVLWWEVRKLISNHLCCLPVLLPIKKLNFNIWMHSNYLFIIVWLIIFHQVLF